MVSNYLGLYSLCFVTCRIFLFFSTFILRRKSSVSRCTVTGELVLKENLSLEKMKQTQKKEIEALRNGLLMLFVQELRTPSFVDHRSVERITERQFPNIEPFFAGCIPEFASYG